MAPTKEVLDAGLKCTLTGKLVEASFVTRDGEVQVTRTGGRIVKWKVTDGKRFHFVDEFVGSKFELPESGQGITMYLRLSENNFTEEWEDVPNRYGYKMTVVDVDLYPLVNEDGERLGLR